MKINVNFAQYISVIKIEPILKEKFNTLQQEFEKWYYEEYSGPLGPCHAQRRDLAYAIFNVDVIIDWLNEVYPELHASIIEDSIPVEAADDKLFCMYF